MEITPIIWKSGPTKEGLYPIKIRTTEMVGGKPKTKYSLPVGDPILVTQWDKKNKRVIDHPLAEQYNIKIQERLLEYNKNKYNGNPMLTGSQESFYWWYDEYLKIIKGKKKRKTYKRYLHPLNLLKEFSPTLKIRQFDLAFTMRFESYLLNKPLHPNTIFYTFKLIRQAIKLMIDGGVMEHHKNPLNNYHVKKVKVDKARFTYEQMKIFEKATIPRERQSIERDWHLISFYCSLRFGDRCVLREENYINGRLIYNMRKSGNRINIPIPPKAIVLLEKYNYKYPSKVQTLREITEVYHKDAFQDEKIKIDIIDQQITAANLLAILALNRACLTAALPIVKPHSARYSIADYALRSGLTPAQIQGVMGHRDLATTVIYLKALDTAFSDEGSEKLWGNSTLPDKDPDPVAKNLDVVLQKVS